MPAESVERALKLPVLGTIPVVPAGAAQRSHMAGSRAAPIVTSAAAAEESSQGAR